MDPSFINQFPDDQIKKAISVRRSSFEYLDNDKKNPDICAHAIIKYGTDKELERVDLFTTHTPDEYKQQVCNLLSKTSFIIPNDYLNPYIIQNSSKENKDHYRRYLSNLSNEKLVSLLDKKEYPEVNYILDTKPENRVNKLVTLVHKWANMRNPCN